jgi:penicillin-binding protein 2
MVHPGSYEDRHELQRRLTLLQIVVGAAFALLAVGFWILQVLSHEKYREMADSNYIRTIPLRAPRGALYDREGRLLADNRGSMTITLLREGSADLDEAIRRLAMAVGVEEAKVREIVHRRRREPMYRPIVIVEHATESQVASVMARQQELPEAQVRLEPTRSYLSGPFAAHLFGYVGEIQESQLARPEFQDLSPGAVIGQAGLEKIYNARLMGRDGRKDVVVTSDGREVEALGEEAPVPGERLQLTIDLDLQRALEEAFAANDFAGAAVFMDPRTGEILAMTSQPAFNPNDFATGISAATWTALQRDPRLPLQDRLIQGRYSPGSTFKILMAIAGLAEGVITPETTFYCPGSAVFYGHPFRCDKKEGHGTIALRHAIEKSCNVYFYNVGYRLNIDTIHAYAQKLGLIGKTGIDLPEEKDSLVPSTEWKQRTFKERWYPSETISVAIGQGAVSVTPISLATMMATVANGGTVVTPHVVKAVGEGDGWRPVATPAPRAVMQLTPQVLGPVKDGLWMVVNGAGTGSRARIEGKDVSGKTGTAQVISDKGKAAALGRTTRDLRDHGWFEFFAPRENALIAGVVLAEHAGHGGVVAAPIARHVLDTFFAKRDGRPLPPLPEAMRNLLTPPAPVTPPTAGRGEPVGGRGEIVGGRGETVGGRGFSPGAAAGGRGGRRP